MKLTTEQHTELKEKVMNCWENEGEKFLYQDIDNNSYVHYKHQILLDNPFECVNVLGFESVDEYLLSLQEEDMKVTEERIITVESKQSTVGRTFRLEFNTNNREVYIFDEDQKIVVSGSMEEMQIFGNMIDLASEKE